MSHRWVGLFQARTQNLLSTLSLNARDWLPQIEFPHLLLTGLSTGRPAIEWEITGTKSKVKEVDILMNVIGWQQSSYYWLALSPVDWCDGTKDCGLTLEEQEEGPVHVSGKVRLPELDASFAPYLPPTAGIVDGPVGFATDLSWREGYDDLAADEDLFYLLTQGFATGQGASSFKVMAGVPTSFSLRQAPGSGGSAGVTRLPLLKQLMR